MTEKTINKFRDRLTAKLLASVLLGLCLVPGMLANTAQADDDRAPASGRSSGGRGCGTSARPDQPGVPALILLAPSKQPGQTTSTRPTFAWFVRDTDEVPLEFRIYEQDNNRFTLVKELKGDRLKASPGIMLLTLDDSTPLMVGKRYRWQVELICNPSRPAGDPFAEAEIEVVPLQSGLKNLLGQTRDRLDQARLFDQANLWYDVIGLLFNPTAHSIQPNDFVSALFGKIALNSTEKELLQNSTVRTVRH